jgi:hypothetical protein
VVLSVVLYTQGEWVAAKKGLWANGNDEVKGREYRGYRFYRQDGEVGIGWWGNKEQALETVEPHGLR